MNRILSAVLRESPSPTARPGGGRMLLHYCPGCNTVHRIAVSRPNAHGAVWAWNQDVDKPTFHPPIHLCFEDPKTKAIKTSCHYSIIDGMIRFEGDSVHALAGKTVPMPNFPKRFVP